MAQDTVRCPYCVLDSGFRPMTRRSEKSFVCVGCGHLASPEDPYLRCSCQKCRQMNRVASRFSNGEPDLPPAVNS